ncbi:MAG: hypothetical protein K8R08_12210 [Methanosarcinales archaeon]|nr:hypothetical protein [Methanosarcinales archaeon]
MNTIIMKFPPKIDPPYILKSSCFIARGFGVNGGVKIPNISGLKFPTSQFLVKQPYIIINVGTGGMAMLRDLHTREMNITQISKKISYDRNTVYKHLDCTSPYWQSVMQLLVALHTLR